MAARGTTFAKMDRDRAKKAKAAQKRERRESRDRAGQAPAPLPADPSALAEGREVPADQLLRLVEELHRAFSEQRIDFEEFEARKADLMARISV